MKSLLSLLSLFLHFFGDDLVIAESRVCDKLSVLDLIPKNICPKNFVPCIFSSWRFDRRQILASSFPLDPIAGNYVRQVHGCLFSVTYPTPLKTQVRLIAFSKPVLTDVLDLFSSVTNDIEFVNFVGGSQVLSGSLPLSHRYGGHQFGYWSGQLGDGRAVMLGEYVNHRGERWELQLKGSGRTPYSRHGDGRAVLRSSVREFLCSEAMFHLGIPTSRAAAIVVSDDPVVRDQFYDGRPQTERAAVVLRLAQSWFRIGSLEILAKNNELELLQKLLDFVIKNHFHEIDVTDGNRYVALYSAIVSQTGQLMAQWQSVGFTHGVCNTDNFSLLSITIDYGPFGFMEEYNPKFVPNTSDDEGRYSFENQPDIGAFNLDKLGDTLKPVLNNHQVKQLSQILKGYERIYKETFMELFTRKLGLLTVNENDENLVALFLKIMEDTKSDFTMSFRELGEIDLRELNSELLPLKYWALSSMASHEWFWNWMTKYKARLRLEGCGEEARQVRMSKVNPRYILRNWMAQQVIEQAERNNFRGVRNLLRVLEHPMEWDPEGEEAGYASPPPSWSKLLRVSCSS